VFTMRKWTAMESGKFADQQGPKRYAERSSVYPPRRKEAMKHHEGGLDRRHVRDGSCAFWSTNRRVSSV